MSAIVAAVGRDLSPESAHWVREATAYCRPAGPDGDAVHHERDVGLGHTLLRTGPFDADGPITIDGRTWLTADARLDDRNALISKLRGAGRTVDRATPDGELVLHAYASWPANFLDHLAGDFAFALWDEGTLLCARDQLGSVPLYYARYRSELLVSTSLDALRLHPAVRAELDERWIVGFLLTTSPPDFESTVYRDVRRLAPAHTLRWREGSVAIRRYWSLPESVPLERHAATEEYSRRFAELLSRAVGDRITGGDVTVQLSGGMDSTSVAASAVNEMLGRGLPATSVRGVSATLGGTSGDREGELAGRVADKLSIALDLIDGSRLPVLDPMQEPEPALPEPAPYRRTSFEYDIGRIPAAHSRVGLTGVGGDQLLAFNPWYWAEWLRHGQALRLVRVASDHARLFGERLHPAVREGVRMRATQRMARIPEPPVWFAHRMRDEVASQWRAVHQADATAESRDVRSFVTNPFWTSICQLGDPAVTGLAVRFRHPLLDLRLVRFVQGLPPEPWLLAKRVMREAMRGQLPDEVLTRPKTLLVDAPRPGQSTASDLALRSLVRGTPEAAAFLDPDVLDAQLARAPDESGGATGELVLKGQIGLVHWLRHRKPVAIGDARPPLIR